MDTANFRQQILLGIPNELPAARPYDTSVSHAPNRKDSLTEVEKKLALRNALRYFDQKHHPILAKEFYNELISYGRIYMYRFRPMYTMHARPISDYPCRSIRAAAIMLM